MNIKDMQKRTMEVINQRLSKKGIEPSIDLTMSHLIEEVGEIASQINNGKLKRGVVNVHNIGEEISDSILLLTYLASQYNLDLEKTISEKMEEITNKKI